MSNRPGTDMIFMGDELEHKIIMPMPSNPSDRSYEQIHRDIGRIQWFSKGNGGQLADQVITLQFEKDEYHCCMRYLLRVGWKRGETCPMCAALLDDKGEPVTKGISSNGVNPEKSNQKAPQSPSGPAEVPSA